MKKDSGIYKCISQPPAGGELISTETELQVIDTSYIPEIDDWVVRPFLLLIITLLKKDSFQVIKYGAGQFGSRAHCGRMHGRLFYRLVRH